MKPIELLDKREQIRIQLKNGATIQDICNKYTLTLSDLFHMMQYYDNTPERNSKPKSLMYITEKSGHYSLRKAGVNYGTYRSVEDAVKVRDYFLFNRWDKRNVDRVCKIVGVERVIR